MRPKTNLLTSVMTNQLRYQDKCVIDSPDAKQYNTTDDSGNY